MLKRLLLLVALGAALAACSPSGSASSPGAETIAPVESAPAASEMPSESASPS
jgi:predicted small lipoprotein YifL